MGRLRKQKQCWSLTLWSNSASVIGVSRRPVRDRWSYCEGIPVGLASKFVKPS